MKLPLLLYMLVFSLSTGCLLHGSLARGQSGKKGTGGGAFTMGRIWQSGFETGNHDEWLETGAGTPTGNENIDTVIVHGGTQSLHQFPNNGEEILKTIGWNLTEIYVRFYIYLAADTTGRSGVFVFSDTLGTFQSYCQVILDPGRLLTLNNTNTSTNIGSSAALSLNTWHRVEVHCKAGTPTNGVMELRVDGITQVSSSTQTTGGGGNIDGLQIGGQTDTGDYYIDDFAANSTVGTVNNSWPGEGFIVLMQPNGDSSPLQWTPTPAGTHWSTLAGLPGVHDDTTFISESSATNLTDRWTMSDTPAAMASNANIAAICWGVRGGGDGTTTRTAELQAVDTNGNLATGLNTNWNVAGWKNVYPSLINEQTWAVTPAALTKAYCDGLFGQALETQGQARKIQWSQVWASVDYSNPAVIASVGHRLALMGVGH